MLKGKFKSLLGKESDEINPGHIDISEATKATNDFVQQEEVVREFENDPTPDTDIIDTIESTYFSDMDFDSSLHELQKLPEELSEEDLDKYRNNLRRQLQAVSKQLSQKILDNQRAYVQGLDRVMELESNLQKATKTCKDGRRKLAQAEEAISVNALQLLSKNRRKVLLENLLKSLRFIKTLQQTDLRLKELLQEQNYASAIQLCLECQQAAITFHQYHCISELSSNLQEILEQIEEQLDNALSKVCRVFSKESYGKIQEAYALLGKTQIAMDQLQMHFVNTINTVAQSSLAEAVSIEDNIQFSNICSKIPFEKFIPCLLELSKRFWCIMFNYKHIMQWHEEKRSKENESESESDSLFGDEYIKCKLDQGIERIWQDVQQKIKVFVLSANFAYFKYDDFIRVLDIINRLICVGEDFSKNKSETLQESIQMQTINYFKAYHKVTLEELKMFLENEAWQLCPVKSSFKIHHLQEFCFMKTQLLTRSASNDDILSDRKGFFEQSEFTYEKTPFHNLHAADKEAEDAKKYDYFDDEDDDDDDEDDIPDELKQDFVDENTGEDVQPRRRSQRKGSTFSENTLIVTNTTLNVLRSFGKYMQMMSVLKPIAFDVVLCMSQLFDYYMYSVFTFFACRQDSHTEDCLSKLDEGKLKICLQRIHSTINSNEVSPPSLSMMVDLNEVENMHGFNYRIIGVESLSFLASQLRLIYKNLESLIPINKRAFLSQFYSQTVDVASDLRLPVFQMVGKKVIPYDKILQKMLQVRWDPKEIMSQHNSYVDALVQEYQNLQNRINQMKNMVPVPKSSAQNLWKSVLKKSNRIFVEGFSSAKKCSNEGRALMLLDFQQFLMKVDKITNVKPVPDREYVENYIKAFYLSEAILEQWLSEHQEYTPKQLNNLVTCGTASHIGKKMRQKLLGLLDELESKHKPNTQHDNR
ncbi:syndetin-like [Clytia hemisphaerica]|uniref:Syndetin n=1 Tax=Clytia hemisphaerica TaxID=252671 RepID=A0A7M5XDF7_9CNID|eukprot:TCONS_00002658-protein